MKINDEKMHETLKQFSVPDYDRHKLQETIKVSIEAYKGNFFSRRIDFGDFIRMQVRFIGGWIWIIQAMILIGFLVLISQNNFEGDNLKNIVVLFSLAAPMIAFVGFPELLKSYAHDMEEIELCTRFSMRKLIAARMIILGFVDLFCLTIILAVSAFHNDSVFIFRMILYLVVPFNVTCCGCITVMNHVKSRQGGYYCGIICFLCMAVFGWLSFVKSYYETVSQGVWLIMFLITTFYFASAVIKYFKGFAGDLEKEHTISIRW